jgi:Transcriptional regulators
MKITLCVSTGGGMDYVLHVYTPSLSMFQDLMDGLLEAELGIDRYMTYIVTRRIKSQQPSVAKLIAHDAK